MNCAEFIFELKNLIQLVISEIFFSEQKCPENRQAIQVGEWDAGREEGRKDGEPSKSSSATTVLFQISTETRIRGLVGPHLFQGINQIW